MHVLVAEDDPIIALGLARRLAQLGHEVIGPVGREEEVLRLAREGTADLYLMDIDLEDANGLELVGRLAEEGLGRPVVILTGLDMPELIDRAILSGAEAFLTKPVDDRQLDAALRLALARHGENQALLSEFAEAQQALEDRKVIEQAKGLLMAAFEIDEPTAFGRMRRTARNRNLRLIDVANLIIEQRSLLE